MSCNGCRVLRRGCSDQCILRPCLEWIQTPQAQGNAVLFVAKFFGRSDLMSFVAAVPENRRPALFQSLLFEACGRTVNPVSGAVGLLSTGNWHVCQAAMNTVLSGGELGPMTTQSNKDGEPEAFACGRRRRQSSSYSMKKTTASRGGREEPPSVMENTASVGSEISEVTAELGGKEPKLLNLFS